MSHLNANEEVDISAYVELPRENGNTIIDYLEGELKKEEVYEKKYSLGLRAVILRNLLKEIKKLKNGEIR